MILSADVEGVFKAGDLLQLLLLLLLHGNAQGQSRGVSRGVLRVWAVVH